MKGSTLDIIYRALTSDQKGQVNTKYKSRLAEDFESVEIESGVKEKLINADTPDIARQILMMLIIMYYYK